MTRSAGRSAALVAAGIFLSRLVGFVRERVFAHYFGNSAAADAVRARCEVYFAKVAEDQASNAARKEALCQQAEALSASYRDPSGRVFDREGAIFRTVTSTYIDDYRALMSSGLYEALKCGIIGSVELFLRFEQNRAKILKRDPLELEWLIAQAWGTSYAAGPASSERARCAAPDGPGNIDDVRRDWRMDRGTPKVT